jgi:4-hydroxybenzoate polyprenyltransferase
LKDKFTTRPCFKGAIMVIIGILLTRMGWGDVGPTGFGRLTTNLIFAPISYFLIALAGLFMIKIIKVLETPSQDAPTPQINTKIFTNFLIFVILYIVGIFIMVCNVIRYNIDLYAIYFIIFIGILWLLLGYYAIQKQQAQLVRDLIVTLAFTLGIFYGAISNIIFLPIWIYLIFLAAFFLQFSRELVKRFPDEGEKEGADDTSEELEQPKDPQKILKISLIFQLAAIGFLILIFLTLLPYIGIYAPVFYLWPMIPGAILIGVASFFTWKSLSSERKPKRIRILLRIAILIELIAFILAS